MSGDFAVNTGELGSALMRAEVRVLKIQAKLHRWARDDPHRRFDDLFNLVADPGFLLVAWDRVRGNRGARTAGVDGRTAPSIEMWVGVGEFLDRLRSQVKDGSFRPMPVLEPIFEADFLPCSYGFRPNRRAHDAVAEVRLLTSKKYEWVVEGDIKACLNAWSHCSFVHCGWSEQPVLGGWGFDTQAFPASGADVDGAEPPVLDTLHDGLAGDAVGEGGFQHGQPAAGGVVHE